MFDKLLNLIKNLIGNVEYIVTSVNKNGDVQQNKIHKYCDVIEFVSNINNEKYWNVQKIEKIRRLDFNYNNEIVHKPLWFQIDNVTESDLIDGQNYSFLKKHKTLKNIKRINN